MRIPITQALEHVSIRACSGYTQLPDLSRHLGEQWGQAFPPEELPTA